MAFIPDPNNISIDFGNYIIYVPKSATTLVQSVPSEIRELDLNWFRLQLKDIEDSVFGIAELRTHKHNTTVTVGGVDLARVIEIINGYTVTFEDGQYAVTLIGANSNVGDVINVNQVSIRTANSVGLVTSKAIEFGEYGGVVTVKIGSPYAGTIYPTGTYRQPVNNIPDAVALCVIYGFPQINVVGDLTLTTGDNVEDLKLVGTSHINSVLVVEEGADCLRTAFDAFDMTGYLDGDSEIVNCVVRDLEYFNGHIHDSYLAGNIRLRGASQANISDCSILDILNPPIIDAGGSGQNLMMPNFSGLAIIDNLTGNSNLGIGLSAGQIQVNDTCTSGVIAVSGSGFVEDNSGDDCYVVDTVTDGSEVSNLQVLVENLKPHHTGTGNVWFWNPHGGNDAFAGDHPKRATKTFARAHEYAVDNNHDIIICVSGNPNGQTYTTEHIIISKNYLFVRGPGRDFCVHGTDLNLPTIDITGEGVEFSGAIVTTELDNTISAIRCTGGFPLIKNTYIEESVNGILFQDGNHGSIDNVRIGHNTGFGVRINGDTSHFTIDNSHIGSNQGGGVIIDTTTGHEVTIKRTIIHDNIGYGVDVVNCEGVQILPSTTIFGNSLGDYQGVLHDLRQDYTNVSINPLDITAITDSVLDTDITPYAGGSGLGGVTGTIEDKIDIIDTNVDAIGLITTDTNTTTHTIDGKVDVIDANIDQVLINNGLISAEIADLPLDIWNFDSSHNFIPNSMGEELSHIKYINHFVFVDAGVLVNGDGSQHEPFDNITDAIDLAEANNTTQMIIFSDINIDRHLKNFTIIGVGNPRIDFELLPDLKGTTFKDCILAGQHTSYITAKNCKLETGLSLNGRYIVCGLNGDLVCSDGANIVFVDSASVIPGNNRPSVSMNPTGYCSLSMRSQRGGLTIKDCNNPLDVVTVGVSEGSLTFDSSCTDGEMVARGSCVFVDEASIAGANVTDETFSPFDTRNINLQVWNTDKDFAFNVNSMGEWVTKKLLTIKLFLGI